MTQDELFSLCETLCAGGWDQQRREAKEKLPDIAQLVMEPRRLLELLHISTLIAQGQIPLFSVNGHWRHCATHTVQWQHTVGLQCRESGCICVEPYEWRILCLAVFFYLGAEKLSEGRISETLSGLQTASSLPAPRTLVAYTHLLSGACLASMVCVQTKFLHLFKKKKCECLIFFRTTGLSVCIYVFPLFICIHL